MPGSLIIAADDEPPVLDYIQSILRTFRVKPFSSPSEAVNFLGALQEPPLLLITDVVMPRLNGVELAKTYQTFFPKMPVLLISGYSSELLSDVPKSWRFLGKPFTPAQLKAAVKALVAV